MQTILICKCNLAYLIDRQPHQLGKATGWARRCFGGIKLQPKRNLIKLLSFLSKTFLDTL